MPCVQVARGIANPSVVPPFSTPSAPSLPFDDEIDNNPCGKPIVAAIDGVDMSMHQLCVGHLALKLGLAVFDGPVANEGQLTAKKRSPAKKTTARRR